jgi:Kelch motif
MLWSFDPATSEWTRLQNLPEGIHHPGFAAVGGKLYSVGGFTIARPPTGLPAWVPSKSVWIYDIGSASWSKARSRSTGVAPTHRVASRFPEDPIFFAPTHRVALQAYHKT